MKKQEDEMKKLERLIKETNQLYELMRQQTLKRYKDSIITNKEHYEMRRGLLR